MLWDTASVSYQHTGFSLGVWLWIAIMWEIPSQQRHLISWSIRILFRTSSKHIRIELYWAHFIWHWVPASEKRLYGPWTEPLLGLANAHIWTRRAHIWVLASPHAGEAHTAMFSMTPIDVHIDLHSRALLHAYFCYLCVIISCFL